MACAEHLHLAWRPPIALTSPRIRQVISGVEVVCRAVEQLELVTTRIISIFSCSVTSLLVLHRPRQKINTHFLYFCVLRAFAITLQ